jgi:hypothetical protein
MRYAEIPVPKSAEKRLFPIRKSNFSKVLYFGKVTDICTLVSP